MSLRDFQKPAFIPFAHYVAQAKLKRHAIDAANVEFVRRAEDKINGFVDTIPMDYADDVTTIEPEVIQPEKSVTGNEASDMLKRAQYTVAREAYLQCLHAGYFPPTCQKCGR